MIAILAALVLSQGREITQAQVATRALNACDRGPYSALLTIRAINAVVDLGPQQSRTFLDRYFKSLGSRGKGNLYPFIRCIFDVQRNGYLALPRGGKWDPMPPINLRLSPRFPCDLIGDVPLVIASVVTQPEAEGRHYIYLSTFGKLRTRPLVPTNRPWLLVGPSRTADNVSFSSTREAINQDILSLVSTAYRPKGYVGGKPSPYTHDPAGWRATCAQMQSVGMYWNPNQQMYVRADGTTLPGR
jgi:hypothetical protein